MEIFVGCNCAINKVIIKRLENKLYTLVFCLDWKKYSISYLIFTYNTFLMSKSNKIDFFCQPAPQKCSALRAEKLREEWNTLIYLKREIVLVSAPYMPPKTAFSSGTEIYNFKFHQEPFRGGICPLCPLSWFLFHASML